MGTRMGAAFATLPTPFFNLFDSCVVGAFEAADEEQFQRTRSDLLGEVFERNTRPTPEAFLYTTAST